MNMRALIFTVFLAFITVAVFATITLFYNFDKGVTRYKTTFIPQRSSLSATARILQDNGVIKSSAKFKILASIMGLTGKVKPGEYEFELPAHPITILRMITEGRVKRYRVTIPEGLTASEIADEIEEKGLGNKEKFMELVNDDKAKQKYRIASPSLEGYLFPETYMIDKTMSEKRIIKTMLDRFFTEVTPDLIKDAEKNGMSLHEVVTLASMIEKETAIDQERPTISAVFHNRLKKNMRLQCDPTVIYGLKDFNGNLTKADLKKKHPYNTYVINGLPKGPIANPGFASIKAAVYPAKNDMLYFVSMRNGAHIFSKTYREHAENVRKYQLRKK